MDRDFIVLRLRARLGEEIADEWVDATDLLPTVNAACDIVGAEIASVDPDRAPVTTTLNAFLAETGYLFDEIALPSNFGRMIDVALLQSDGTYKLIPKKSRAHVMGLVAGDSAAWAFFGNSVIVGPAPSTSQANGVRLRHSGGITLAAGGSVPPFHPALHFAVVLAAHMLLSGETGEDDTPTSRLYARLVSPERIGSLLGGGGGEPETFSPDRLSATEY